MATTKKSATQAPRYRVKAAFAHDGVYIASDSKGQVRALPQAVREDLIERGFIEDLDPPEASTPAPAAKAKE